MKRKDRQDLDSSEAHIRQILRGFFLEVLINATMNFQLSTYTVLKNLRTSSYIGDDSNRRVTVGCLGIAGKCNKVLEHKKGAYFL